MCLHERWVNPLSLYFGCDVKVNHRRERLKMMRNFTIMRDTTDKSVKVLLFLPQAKITYENRHWIFSRAEYAVYGVTFHRIFRIADPFVLRCSAHNLIIKLDRFLLLSSLFFAVPLELDSISNTGTSQKTELNVEKKYKSEICRCCCKGFASTHMVCLQWRRKKGQRVESENVRGALSIGFDGCSNKTYSGEESLWSMTIFSLGLLWGEKNLVCVYAFYCRSLYRPTRGLIFHHQIIQLKCALLMMCYICLCIRWCLGNGIAFVARCICGKSGKLVWLFRFMQRWARRARCWHSRFGIICQKIENCSLSKILLESLILVCVVSRRHPFSLVSSSGGLSLSSSSFVQQLSRHFPREEQKEPSQKSTAGCKSLTLCACSTSKNLAFE